MYIYVSVFHRAYKLREIDLVSVDHEKKKFTQIEGSFTINKKKLYMKWLQKYGR